ncbi:MAG: restriction endonuclease [Lachnospiraceae bacterium]|nr:restriction endonuclease [Lachnospiraceae bacterium]
MVYLCENPICNLPAHHKGNHSFIYKKAWETIFHADDINKIQKAGYCTPRGGAKGGYQNHVNRNSKVIIPYEKLSEVNLKNYKDGYVIRLFPSQYFSGMYTVNKEFVDNPAVIVGDNAFILYRTYEDYELLPPLPDWEIRSIFRYNKKTKEYDIFSEDRRGDITDRGHYLLRISNSGTNKKNNLFAGPAQGIFAPEYADANTNFLCQAVLAWLIIKTENSPYNEDDFGYLKAILQKHNLFDSPHFENNYILHNGKTTCPLCQRVIMYHELNELISFDDEEGLINSTEQAGSTRSTKVNLFHMVPLCYASLENIPTQVSWGHATCNTRLGQRRCFSYYELAETEIEIIINDGQEKRLLGYADAAQKFIRSQNGDVWIRISKGEDK